MQLSTAARTRLVRDWAQVLLPALTLAWLLAGTDSALAAEGKGKGKAKPGPVQAVVIAPTPVPRAPAPTAQPVTQPMAPSQPQAAAEAGSSAGAVSAGTSGAVGVSGSTGVAPSAGTITTDQARSLTGAAPTDLVAESLRASQPQDFSAPAATLGPEPPAALEPAVQPAPAPTSAPVLPRPAAATSVQPVGYFPVGPGPLWVMLTCSAAGVVALLAAVRRAGRAETPRLL